MTNRGVAPVDTSTDIGKMRVKIRDTVFVALDPEEVGYGDYINNSDDELQVFLDDGVSLTRALGYYFLDMASQAALVAINIADHDLKINQEARATKLREVAEAYFKRADEEDIFSGGADIFDSFEFGGTYPSIPVVEGMGYPVWDDD